MRRILLETVTDDARQMAGEISFDLGDRRRIFLETMERVLGGMNKVVIDDNGKGSGVVPYLPLPELERRRTPAPQTGGGS